MFPVETLPAQYFEERAAAAEAARKLAMEQKEAAAKAAAQQAAQYQTQQRQSRPQPFAQVPLSAAALSQAFPPPLAQTATNGVLSNIFQGLVRRHTSPVSSLASSRSHTPGAHARMSEQERREAEALAELKRDTDICAAPGWH